MNQTRNGLTAPHSQPVKNTFKQDRHFTTNQQKKTVCRSRCGIIRTKAKTLVIETTLRLAVYSPTVSGVSLCPNSGAGRGVSMAQREGCGLGAMVRKAIDVTNLTVSTPSPPDAYETVSSGFSVRLGTETMKPTTTPSTQGNTTHDHIALTQHATERLALALFELRNGKSTTSLQRATGLVYSAARSLSQVCGGAHHV